MIGLPEIESYSEDQIRAARQFSPAIDLYLNIIVRDPNEVGDALRIKRHRAWLKASLATYYGKASTQEICRYWTEAAESILCEAMQKSGLSHLPCNLFAFGKLGAKELNLSSDVDLLLVSDSKNIANVEQALKIFRQLLAEHSAFGFCLRLDFDLRPGGRMGPLISTPDQIEDFYWRYGEAWERLSFVRLRLLDEPSQISNKVIAIARKYAFRRYLDYTLKEELKNLRTKIHHQHRPPRAEGFHLKLGPGGIRDIELFTHALQVIHGGRRPELQTEDTDLALRILSENSLIPAEESRLLRDHYWALRHYENLMQIKLDQQSHVFRSENLFTTPSSNELTELFENCEKAHHIVSDLLGGDISEMKTLPSELDAQVGWLESLGFHKNVINETWPQIMETTSLSRKSERDELARKEFLYQFVIEVSRQGVDPNLALSNLLDFMKAIRAKATFFTLFVHEPRVLKELATLFSCTPYLSGILISRPELIDSYFMRSVPDFSKGDIERLLEELSEYRLLTEMIAGSQFLLNKDIGHLGQALTKTADTISSHLINAIAFDLNCQPPRILALGKWGGRELGLASDLDFIFVTRQSPSPQEHKVARRFISRMTEQHKGGSIYNLDLRLRPSGTAGPLIVSEKNLITYLKESAQAWERQSYLKARYISDSPEWIPPMRTEALLGLTKADIHELREIRQKLLKPQGTKSLYDLKYSRGGMIDIEFAVQVALLFSKQAPKKTDTESMLDQLAHSSSSWALSAKKLKQYYYFFRGVTQMTQLLTNTSQTEINIEGETADKLARLWQIDKTQLGQKIGNSLKESADILKNLDPIYLDNLRS